MDDNFWTTEKIKEGFERFKNENGRLPTAPEIDELDYLPTSRQIQWRFGGLEKLRKDLGYEDIHFGKGKYRSAIASNSNRQGREAELFIEKILINKFHEVFVHTEKIFDNSKNRVDFYIYCPDGNFGVDVFSTQTIQNLQKNVNIKIDKYINFPCDLYFVVSNNSFNQADIDASVANKKRGLKANTRIVSLETFLAIIKDKSCYPNPLMVDQ